MKIFLDDQHNTDRKTWIPTGYIGVKNFDEFRVLLESALKAGEQIEAISFDNDLGEGEMEGWEIARWLTSKHPEIFSQNPELNVHSANTPARKNIAHYINLGLRHYKELIIAKDLPNPWENLEKKR